MAKEGELEQQLGAVASAAPPGPQETEPAQAEAPAQLESRPFSQRELELPPLEYKREPAGASGGFSVASALLGSLSAVLLLLLVDSFVLPLHSSLSLAKKPSLGILLPLPAPTGPPSAFEGALLAAARELEEAWAAASPAVREAFARHFMPPPSQPPERAGEPIEVYRRLVQAMQQVEAPQEAPLLRTYKLNLLLLEGVCGAAAQLLQGLRLMELLHQETGVPVSLLNKKASLKFPSFDEPAAAAAAAGDAAAAAVTLNEFLRGFGLDEDLPSKARVPQKTAKALQDLLKLRLIFDSSSSRAHHSFRRFLAALGLDSPLHFPEPPQQQQQQLQLQLLFTKEKFNVDAFVMHSRKEKYYRRASDLVFQDLLWRLAGNWNAEKVAKFAEEQEPEFNFFLEKNKSDKELFLKLDSWGPQGLHPEDVNALVRYLL
ncbi:hypothetical protein, conserved [Eimeria tenella]|uniref:Uncharacterized protein n=1 Tax=Eimeria tenella TaxID=5802 RepID=U6KZC9_EIMTE|nr:hypothetical protein, conserved [Eimeria tenella]CDJ40860.1 hypothetical protein, conserved [Eimeria tenella]|eukprot:XP_013231610.1 hypothetical protein, conserved [Eimeria tenella]